MIEKNQSWIELALKISLAVFIMLLNPFDMETDLDEISRSAFMKLYSPFYPQIAQEDIVVIVVSDEDVRAIMPDQTGDVWPMDYVEYEYILNLITFYNPRSLFIDFMIDTEREGQVKAAQLYNNDEWKNKIRSLYERYRERGFLKEDSERFVVENYQLINSFIQKYKSKEINPDFDRFVSLIQNIADQGKSETTENKKTQLFMIDSYTPSVIFKEVNGQTKYRSALTKKIKDTKVNRVTADWNSEAHEYPLKFDAEEAFDTQQWRDIDLRDFMDEEEKENVTDEESRIKELYTPAKAMFEVYLKDHPELKGELGRPYLNSENISIVWGINGPSDKDRYDENKVPVFQEQSSKPGFWGKLLRSISILNMALWSSEDETEFNLENMDRVFRATWEMPHREYYHETYSASEIHALSQPDHSAADPYQNSKKLRKILENKYVFLGGSIEGIDDTIVSGIQGKIPAVHMHAMALDNLISYNGHYFSAPPSFDLLSGNLDVLEIIEILFLVSTGIFILTYLESDHYNNSKFRMKIVYTIVIMFLTLMLLLFVMFVLTYFFNLIPVNWMALIILSFTFALPKFSFCAAAVDQKVFQNPPNVLKYFSINMRQNYKNQIVKVKMNISNATEKFIKSKKEVEDDETKEE